MSGSIRDKVMRHFATELCMTEEDMPELLDVTRTSLRQCLEDLRAALAGGVPQDAARAAHTLKGNLKNLGLGDYSAVARQIEFSAREGALAGLEDKATAIAEGIRELTD